MEAKLNDLKNRLAEVNDINSAAAVLEWDQMTYMPSQGNAARGRQLATLARIAQQKLIDPQIGRLLDELKPFEESLSYASDDASLIRVTRRTYERATKIPPELIGEYYEHSAISYQVWTEARPANDFKRVQPYLEKTLEISRRIANCFPGYAHIADPLIDEMDFGMQAAEVRSVFRELRQQLVPLVQKITAQEVADDACLKRFFPEEQQRKFGEKIIQDYGFDFERGRQDKTHHPFMTKFAHGDVRITTRFDEYHLGDGLFSTLHEAGHALYELGINPQFDGTLLSGGTSAGVHESQSRLWENIVGRSLGFWEHYYPLLQHQFSGTLDDVSLDQFYRAINKVVPSFIRVDADEVTYNLHVMLRFELELALLEGSLEVKDLPGAWASAFQENFGLAVPDDKDGVLQDVHWYGGKIGGEFQGYTLGNMMSGQFYAAAVEACPNIPAEIRKGEFQTLHTWLRNNIYQYGSKFTANELLEQATGSPLIVKPYIDYLQTKYGGLYNF